MAEQGLRAGEGEKLVAPMSWMQRLKRVFAIDIETCPGGGVFLQGDSYTIEPWGTGRFIPIDCDHMNLEIESEEVTTTIPLSRLSGSCHVPPGW